MNAFPDNGSGPRFISRERAEHLVHDLQGLKVRAEPLYGYYDQNFRIRAGAEGDFVLKIVSGATKQHAVHIDFQAALLRHLSLAKLSIETPVPVPVSSTASSVEITDDAGQSHCAWMLTWVEGELLETCPAYDDAVLRGLGAAIGQIDRALARFSHPGEERYARWDLVNLGDMADLLNFVKSKARRRIISDVLKGFTDEVLSKREELRRSIIHNDGGNQHNMLTSVNADQAVVVSGVIDFGDAVRTHTVFDAGITAAYATFGCDDPAHAITEVSTGFHAQCPLTEPEIRLLPVIVKARLAATVLIAAERKAKEPDNSYGQVSAGPAWRTLIALAGLDSSKLSDRIQDACRS